MSDDVKGYRFQTVKYCRHEADGVPCGAPIHSNSGTAKYCDTHKAEHSRDRNRKAQAAYRKLKEKTVSQIQPQKRPPMSSKTMNPGQRFKS